MIRLVMLVALIGSVLAVAQEPLGPPPKAGLPHDGINLRELETPDAGIRDAGTK